MVGTENSIGCINFVDQRWGHDFPDGLFSQSLLIYLLVAGMALGYRRLIDAGYSPWLLLFMLLGPIGSVILGFIEIFAPSIKHPNL